MDLVPPTSEPSWIFNDRISGPLWKHVPLDILHPWQLPQQLKEYGTVFYQTGPLEDLIPAALRSHIFLTIAELKLIQKELRFPMPPPNQGHGKKGGIVKEDFAEGLINYYFPDLGDKDKSAMLAALLGKGWNHIKKQSVHCHDILAAFQGIDKEDQKEFMDMKEMADVALDEELLINTHEARKDRTSVVGGKKVHETPKSLAGLCAPGGTITRHPQLRRYQGFYFASNVGESEGLTDKQ